MLKSHQRIHLPDELKLQFECDICGKKFTRKQYLVTHKEMHTGKPDDGKGLLTNINLAYPTHPLIVVKKVNLNFDRER